jgi:hypothetical protein
MDATPQHPGLSETRMGVTVPVPLEVEAAGPLAIQSYLDGEFAALASLTDATSDDTVDPAAASSPEAA